MTDNHDDSPSIKAAVEAAQIIGGGDQEAQQAAAEQITAAVDKEILRTFGVPEEILNAGAEPDHTGTSTGNAPQDDDHTGTSQTGG